MKNRKDFPFCMRKRVDNFSEIEKQVRSLIGVKEASSNDTHFIDMKNNKENFVTSAESLHDTYSVVPFHTLSDSAVEEISRIDHEPSTNPVERLRGMKTYEYPYYHPIFDERRYTKKTEYCVGPIEEFLYSFPNPPCRCSLVRMTPGNYLSPHVDMDITFASRFQVPVISDMKTEMGFRRTRKDEWDVFLFEPGHIYFVNSAYEHYVKNFGTEDRYNLRVCLEGQESFVGFTEVAPNYRKSVWYE